MVEVQRVGGQGSLADVLKAAASGGFAVGQDAPPPAEVAGVNIQAADAGGAGNGFARNASFGGFAGMGGVGLGPGDKSGANALGLALVAR